MNDAYDPVATVAFNCEDTTIPTSGWVEVFSGGVRTIRSMASFNSTGRIIALSHDGVNALPFTVIPGGDIPQEFLLDGSTKLYAKCIDVAASDGYLVLNFFG